jgi:hypothetical protein
MKFLSFGQVLKISTTPSIIANQIPGYSQVTAINTKTYSYTPSTPVTPITPIDEDTTTESDQIYVYGDVISATISNSDGNVTSTSIGKVWTVRVSIPNALNIGLIFDQFNLSTNAEMYIFNEDRTVLDSAIKKADFTNSSFVNISSLKGNSIIIYIVELNNFSTFQSVVSVQKLIAGFEEIGDVGEIGGSFFAKPSVNCHPLIQCSQSKIPYARGVARMLREISPGLYGACTGTLINNESNNGRPYFLTAFHCVDVNKNGILEQSEIDELATNLFQFQFWRRVCNGTENNKLIEFTGATLRASSHSSDVVLLELNNPPGIGDGVNYVGWNRQTSKPADYGSFIIHHPQAQDMRLAITDNVKSWLFNSNYWTAHYASGAVDKGSSGSALLNENGQIIGQLRGGWSNCNFTDFGDRYGKLDRSWTGASLQQWLSPTQGLQSTGLLNLTDVPIYGAGVISCTSPSQYTTLPGLLDVTYEWVVSAGLQILSGQGTSAVTISGFSNNQYGSGILTLILRSPTKGRNRVLTVTKNITINTGGNGSISGTYNSPSNASEILIPTPPKTLNPPVNAACIVFATNMTIPANSTVTWSGTTSSNDVTWSQAGNNLYCNFTEVNQTGEFTISVTNSCGTSSARYKFQCTTTQSCGIQPSLVETNSLVVLSPNPAQNDVNVELVQKSDNNKKREIKEIRIIDKMGNIKSVTKVNGIKKNVLLNISRLTADLYTIQVFDGKEWQSAKLIKN